MTHISPLFLNSWFNENYIVVQAPFVIAKAVNDVSQIKKDLIESFRNHGRAVFFDNGNFFIFSLVFFLFLLLAFYFSFPPSLPSLLFFLFFFFFHSFSFKSYSLFSIFYFLLEQRMPFRKQRRGSIFFISSPPPLLFDGITEVFL